MIWAILFVPALCGCLCPVIRPSWPRRALLLAAAALQAALVGSCWVRRPADTAAGWLGLDAAGLLFLSLTTALFLVTAVYAVGYFRQEAGAKRRDWEEGFLFTNRPEAMFTACLLWFLAAMSLVSVSRHLGLLWAAVEATTLASAPLIYFHRHHRSLEAAWKYLLICSVGIALAMLGNFFLAVAGSAASEDGLRLTLDSLLESAAGLDPTWFKAAFILCLVGYGTKMGLAPMHTWLPDAHSEAPSIVSALLSGALLNCAFLALLRLHAVSCAAALGDFSGSLLMLLGLLSMVLAALFLIHQSDFKRMLAYSSVENMGILALGVGSGGVAVFGSLFHAVNHSLVKAMLFLAAGNILAACHTKSSAEVRGLLRSHPVTAALWLAGLLAVIGMPPFGAFFSELVVLRGIVGAGRYALAAVYLAALGVTFVAMARIVLPMVFGKGQAGDEGGRVPIRTAVPEPLWAILPPLALCLAAVAVGLHLPAWLNAVLQSAAAQAGGQP